MTVPHSFLAFLGPIGWPEMLILGFLGLLIFGNRLPAVGKSMGQFITGVKKGLRSTADEIEEAANTPAPAPQLQSEQKA